jgi:hypothetical protein
MRNVALIVMAMALLVPQVTLGDDQGKDVYAGTDSERLSRRVDQFGEAITEKGKAWYAKGKHVLENATRVEQALDNLRQAPKSWERQITAFEVMYEEAGRFRPLLQELLEKQNPDVEIKQVVLTLDELIALNKSKGERWRMLAQNAASESLRNRYVKMAEAVDRNARTYDQQKQRYAGIDIESKITEFRGELEFLNEYQTYCQEMIVHLRTAKKSAELLEEVESMSDSLEQLAQALLDFSKIISEQYDESPSEA